MYRIYLIHYWTALPLRDLLTIFRWLNIEGPAEREFMELDSAIMEMKNVYDDRVYAKPHNGGTECLLCGIVDSDDNVMAVLNFDGTVLYNAT